MRVRDDGERIEAWSTDCSVWSWDLESHEEHESLKSMRHAAARAVLTPRGRLLVVGDAKTGVLRFYRTDDGSLMHAGTGGEAKLKALAVSPSGTLVAVARDDGTLRVWDLEQGEQAAPRVTAIAADARSAFHVTRDNRIEIRTRGVEGQKLLPAEQKARITALAPTPDGKRLLTVSIDGRIVAWDVERAEKIRALRGHGEVLTAVAWAEIEDGRFYTGNIEGRVRIWTWPKDIVVSFETATADPIALIARARNAERIVAADTMGGIYRWECIHRKRVGAWNQPSRIVALAISPDGQRMAAVRSDSVLLTAEGGDDADWVETGTIPRGTTLLHLEIADDGKVTWVDTTGRGGEGLALALVADLPVVRGGTSWMLVGPAERLRRYRRSYGLVLDSETFRVKHIDPKKIPGSIGLAR